MTPNPPVILSEDWGTARIVSYEDTLPDATVAVVLGAVSGGTRIIVEVGDTTATGIDRREVIVDAGSLTDTTDLTAKGEEALAVNTGMTVELEYIPESSFEYGVSNDFTVGDIVSVDAGIYGAYDLRVVAVTRVWSADGPQINLTLGSEATDLVKMIRDVRRELSAVRI